MPLLFAFLLFLLGTCLILFLPALWVEHTYRSYRDGRTVNCPETHAPVSVRFNAWKVAWTSLSGPPKLRLADCTRWPERTDCGQECIPDAWRAAPSTAAVEHVPWRTRRVVHLPVLLAGAAAWVLGMAWHSQYLFRPQWAAALGLSNSQALALARIMAPHLLSVGACILFAYGVAGLLRWLGSRTLTHGLEVSAALWMVTFAALMAATWSRLSPELLKIEGVYTLLAALLIGAIVGGVPRWVVMGDPEERGIRSVK
ncbi:MAG: DUF1761 domain-containing protein [Terriglobales bacterium]